MDRYCCAHWEPTVYLRSHSSEGDPRSIYVKDVVVCSQRRDLPNENIDVVLLCGNGAIFASLCSLSQRAFCRRALFICARSSALGEEIEVLPSENIDVVLKIVGISIRERSTAHRRRKSPCIIMHSRDRDGKGRHAPQNRRRRSALGSLSRRERVAASRFALAIRQNGEKHGKTIAIARSRERRKPKHAEPRFVKWTASI